MKKGIISLAIVLAMVVSMFVPAFAAEATAVEPVEIIDFAAGDRLASDPALHVDATYAGGTSAYNEEVGAWEFKVAADQAKNKAAAQMLVPSTVNSTACKAFAITLKIVNPEGKSGAYATVAQGGVAAGLPAVEGSTNMYLSGETGSNEQYATLVMKVPTSSSTTGFGRDTITIYVTGATSNDTLEGTAIYIDAIAFFATEDEAKAFDLAAYREANKPVPPSEPVKDIYFDNNLFYDDVENNDAYASEDGAAIIIDKTLDKLGGFRCTTHVTSEFGGCLSDVDFFVGYPEAFIRCQVTKNAKYAKVDEPEYVADFDGEEGEGTEGGIRFTVTPIDNYITKDIDIEIQMYVIRNEAQQAHRSNTVKFDLSITNRYIDDDDIAAIAGEDCSLFIDETGYAVKGSQFEEAGDKSVSIAWWNAKKPNDSKFVINFKSVVGQNGINFGSSLVTKELLDEAVKAVKDLNKDAKWDGIAFGSEEVIVNGATVSILNSFGETFKYAYQLDAEGNLTYVGEYTKDAKYIEFEVEAGEALGSFLVSDKKIETAPVEPDEPSEDEDDKDAPGTGAGANMMGLAVFAVVALAGAAVVASKK